MEQIEVKDPRLAEHLRELGHESVGWHERNGEKVAYFPYSREIKKDIRRWRNSEPVGEPIGTLRELFNALRASVTEPTPERPDLPVVNK